MVLADYGVQTRARDTRVVATVCGGADESASFEIAGTGHGTIEGFVNALQDHVAVDITVRDYVQATLRRGTDAVATSRMELVVGGVIAHGVADSEDTVRANFQAILNGVSAAVERLPEAVAVTP